MRGKFFRVTDAFEELGLPRRVLLDVTTLKASFLERAKVAHPDTASGDAAKFESLREAYEILKEPATRLRHLIELETAQSPAKNPPTGNFDLFSAVCKTVEQTRTRVSEASRASGPLARSLAAVQLAALQKSACAIATEINQAEQILADCLAKLDASWPQYEAAAELASDFAFTAKCQNQIGECLFEINNALRGLRPDGQM